MPSFIHLGIAGPATVRRCRGKRREFGDGEPAAQRLEMALSQAAEMGWREMDPWIVHGVNRDCPGATDGHIWRKSPSSRCRTMCGRYDNLIAREAYRRLFKAERLPASNFPPRYNVAPTDQIPIVRIDLRDGIRELTMARWGLVPFWMTAIPKLPHINARMETVARLRMFREAFARRRCLIPATGFFEWEKRADGRQPYRFVMKDLEPFAFAGLWEFARINGEDLLSATIIVGPPNPLTAAIHDRMPMILRPDDYDRWLEAGSSAEEILGLLQPYDEADMKGYEVSRAVNSVKNDNEECITPLAEAGNSQ